MSEVDSEESGQQFYFPSAGDPSYKLREFLENKSQHEYHLPTIVRITSLNIPGRSIKTLLTKNTPLLLLDTYQFESILAEYHRTNDGRYQSNRRRLTQGRLNAKTTMKKFSKSLVTLNTIPNATDENSDEDHDNTRAIIRSLNDKRSSSTPLCRVPANYHGFFELLNENDQSIEPFHHLSDLLLIEDDGEKRIEKWPQAFFLRSLCTAYTKRYIPEERKHSGSADSSYGSLSDLDSHRNLLILNDDKQIIQPGQVITILNPCSAYRSQIIPIYDKSDEFTSHSSTSWIRTKSRFFFSRKKIPTNKSHQFMKKNIYDISKKPQSYLKCQTEQGDIIYIAINEAGLFSPLNSQKARPNDSETLDISGVFQLKELLSKFRFPISVRLLQNSMSFDHIYSPATINPSEASSNCSTKFRLLLPYTENVIFACPLILPSSFKSQTIVIPIPINSDLDIQRCLNMREVLKNKHFHHLIQSCYQTINQYQTEFSYIHFPLILDTLPRRKQPLFKKRSRSESHIEINSSENDRSADMIGGKTDRTFHRDSFEKIKQKLSNQNFNHYQRQQTIRRSGFYAKLKTDKPRKYSRAHEHDSEDENYRELDHIYDYIRSGDVTDDIQRIQAKERAFNQQKNKAYVSTALHVSNVNNHGRVSLVNENSGTVKVYRFPLNLDDSRPLDDEEEDEISDAQYYDFIENPINTTFESINSKSFTEMNRLSN